MMKNLIILLTLMILGFQAQSQKTDDQPVDRLKTLDKSWEIYYFHIFKQHTQGLVFLKNGKQAPTPLNYDMEHQMMTFYKSDGTLNALRTDDVRYIQIESLLFYPVDKVFGEVIAQDKGYELLVCRKIKSKKMASDAYGKVSATSSATNFSSYQYSDTPVQALSEPDVDPKTVTYSREDEFVIRHKDRFYPITKRNIQKLFPNLHEQILEFVKENKISYSNYEDVYKFFKHSTSLIGS